MWFITLLVLAVAAVLIIKAVKAHSERQSMDADLPSSNGMQGSLPKGTSGTEQTGQKPPIAPDTTPPNSAPSASESRSPETLADIREMVKILNLAESDAARLGISSEEFAALRDSGDAGAVPASLPDTRVQEDVAERLRRMLN